jgi:MFS family permease
VHSDWSLRQRLWRLNLIALVGVALSVLWPGHGWFGLYALGNFLLGLGIGVGFPILLSLMIDEQPAQASRLSGLLMVSFTLGAQAAGLLIGVLNDRFGVRAGYAVLLLAALALTAAAWRLCRPSGATLPAVLRSGTMDP